MYSVVCIVYYLLSIIYYLLSIIYYILYIIYSLFYILYYILYIIYYLMATPSFHRPLRRAAGGGVVQYTHEWVEKIQKSL